MFIVLLTNKITQIMYFVIKTDKSFGFSEVLMWFRDGGFRGGHW